MAAAITMITNPVSLDATIGHNAPDRPALRKKMKNSPKVAPAATPYPIARAWKPRVARRWTRLTG